VSAFAETAPHEGSPERPARKGIAGGQRTEAATSVSHGRAFRLALGIGGLLLLLALWWFATDLIGAQGSFARRFSPTVALPTLVRLLGSDLPLHIFVSLKRVAVSLAMALVIGVPIGLLVGISRVMEAATTPAFQFLRMISPLSWMPIAVMVFGIGDAPIYFMLAFAAVWPVLLSTAAGVRQLDPHWLLLARSLSATGWEMLWRVILPGILGSIVTGMRLAIGISWIVLVPCEMLGVHAGIGYFILDTRDRLAYDELMATVLAIGIIGYGLDLAARSITDRFAPGSR
jgi:NitT/TauT family transport system permease protein